MLAEMRRELSFHPEINFIVRDAAGRTEKQIEQIQELTEQHIDLLIVSPNEAAPVTPVVEKAFQKGIPVIVVDRITTSQNYTAYVGASNYEVGANAATFANSLLRSRGNVLEVSDIPGSSADIGRHKGFTDFIKQHPEIKYVTKLYEEGDENPSGEKLTAFLQSNRNIQLIFAQNDRLAFSGYKVCRTLGLDKKISIIGVDGLAGPNGGLDLVERGLLKATILYPTGGKEAIQVAADILAGRRYQKENKLESIVIDSSNVHIMRLQTERVAAQQLDIDKGQRKIEEQMAITRNQTNIILAISVVLAVVLILAGVLFYFFQENRKINRKLEWQKEEISTQRNRLIELVEKLKEATDAKFNFFTNISHELRTPLALIMGPLEDALSSPKLHFTVKNNLHFMHRNTVRLLRLINQLMDFRKVEEGKMKLAASENNLTAFVTDITGAFADLARQKSIAFRVRSKAHDLTVWFDGTMLDKVLFNLLSNAFKFTGRGGAITVTVDKTADGSGARITVEDTGVGMSEEDLNHAFELFYQGHSRTFRGTGLGLALSKELITLHGGTIAVKSEKGKGTAFEIGLPLGKAHLRPEEMVTEAPALVNTYEDLKIYTTDIAPLVLQNEERTPAAKEASVLIIEDNDDLRTFLNRRLSNTYEVKEAENGESGLALAFDTVPDIIVADVILPGQSGLQLTETLKQDIRTSHIPVILLTAKGAIEDQIRGIKMRADAFVVKPFNLEYLEETIKNLLRSRAALREHYTSELPMEARANASGKLDRKFISEFTAIVENNIPNENFTVDEICKQIGISRVQLYRKVKALIGYNINDYILAVRLQKAKYLLANENLSISEVAFRVGFASGAYFSTVFKSKFSMTPSEYKEQKKR